MNIRGIGTPQQVDLVNEVTEQQHAQSVAQPEPVGLSSADSIENLQQINTRLANPPSATRGSFLPNLDQLPPLKSWTVQGEFESILSYFGVKLNPGEVSKNLGVLFTPNDMIDFARSKGLAAEGYNHASLDQMKGFIDKGYPVMAAVSLNGIDKEMVIVTGHRIDDKRNPPMEVISFIDSKGQQHEWPDSYFEEAWAKGGMGQSGFNTGYENYMMVFAPGGTDLPSGNEDGAETASGINEGMFGLSHGWDLMADGGAAAKVHGFFDFLGGGVGLIGSGIGWMVFQAPAQAIHDKVDGIPVLQNLVQPLCDIWDTGGAIIGDVFKGFESACDDFGGALEALGNGDLSGFAGGLYDTGADVAGAVVDVVSDAVGGAVDAIGDFLSW